MSFKFIFILLALSGAAGIALGYVLRWLIALGQRGSLEIDIKQQILETNERAARILADAKARGEMLEQKHLEDASGRAVKLAALEERLAKKEDFLDEREHNIAQEAESVRRKENEARKFVQESSLLSEKHRTELSRVARMSQSEACEQLIQNMEELHEESLLARLQKLETQGKERFEDMASNMLISTIHRLGNAVNAETMSLSVTIPSEEEKGKIIGKEGRNIKAFERATGVDVIIDDSPNHITLSSFDPLRRYIAKLALEELITDGRIQPAKIEAVVARTKKEAALTIRKKGEEAAYEAGVVGLDSKLISLLGRLYFRTSYGQNVLRHSIEMAHLSGMLAEELGASPNIARAGALLHDIGKAVDHEVQGTHVEIGRRILEKFNVDKKVIQAMQSHHEEYPYETLESKIVQVADAISAGRPGARRDTIERYLERLGELERLASNFPGVEKVYAIQAGREIRVFVNPGKVSDLAMHHMARNIAKQIQEELKYPGEIKVNIIRENRVVEFAR